MVLIELNEFFIKEILYEYYRNDKKVEDEYKNLKICTSKYKQSESQFKNIGFFLTELCILNLEYHSKQYKYLKLWNDKYTLKILNYFKLSASSLKNGLMIYHTLTSLFKTIIQNQKKCIFLTKDEYIHIHSMFHKTPDLSYFFLCKKILKNDCMVLTPEFTQIDDREVIWIDNKHAIILPEMKDTMKKLNVILNDPNRKIKICNCNDFHTNQQTISFTDTNIFYLYSMVKSKTNVIVECNGNDLKYSFLQYIMTSE